MAAALLRGLTTAPVLSADPTNSVVIGCTDLLSTISEARHAPIRKLLLGILRHALESDDVSDTAARACVYPAYCARRSWRRGRRGGSPPHTCFSAAAAARTAAGQRRHSAQAAAGAPRLAVVSRAPCRHGADAAAVPFVRLPFISSLPPVLAGSPSTCATTASQAQHGTNRGRALLTSGRRCLPAAISKITSASSLTAP